MLSNIILGSIGNNMVNEAEDVFAVKDSLQEIGRFGPEPAPNGILTGDMDDALKGFQRDEGLKVDGIMKPAGETEQAMKGALADRAAERAEGLRKVIERSGVRTAQQPDSLSSLTQNILSQLREQNKPERKSSPLQEQQQADDNDKAGNATDASVARLKALQESRAEAETEEAALEGKPVEFDATGRMMPPRATPIVPSRKPARPAASAINSTALIEQIKARQDANTKSLAETGRIAEKTPPDPRPKPALELESKPVELDATGRMIRPEADPAPAPVPAPIPARKPETGIKPPAFKKDWFKKSDRAENWKDWTRNIVLDNSLNQIEKTVFLDTFAAEGGSATTDGTTVAGVTQKTLNDLKAEKRIKALVQKHGSNIKPSDLDMEDIKLFYKEYNDWAFQGAAKAYTARNLNDPRSGSQMLETIGNKEVAKAMSDVIFREGLDAGTKKVQEAINSIAPKGRKMRLDGAPGTGTFDALRDVATDQRKRRKFLDGLGDLRDQSRPRERERNEYFRFRGNP